MHIAIFGAPGSGKTHLADALARHRSDLHPRDNPPMSGLQPGNFDLILLTGLDLPPGAGTTQYEADALLRSALQQAGVAYGVVYGQGPQRLRNALRLIEPQHMPQPKWTGVCEKCSDPACEHRLFTGLRDLKAAAHRPL